MDLNLTMASSSGLLAGVLDFVSRELGSFVATATGASLDVDDHDDEQLQSPSETPPRRRARRPTPPLFNDAASPSTSKRVSKKTARKQLSESEGASNNQSQRNALSVAFADDSAPSPPRVLRRRHSVSMPGSLFPRSPSLVPDDGRRVRFEVHDRPGPSTPKRTSSVRTAVGRFRVGEGDADPSILLPSPNGSPLGMKLKDPPCDKGKGKAVDVEANTSGEIRVRGKERELAAAKADQRRREDSDEESESSQRDKERIRMLEEEIARLREEVRLILSAFLGPDLFLRSLQNVRVHIHHLMGHHHHHHHHLLLLLHRLKDRSETLKLCLPLSGLHLSTLLSQSRHQSTRHLQTSVRDNRRWVYPQTRCWRS